MFKFSESFLVLAFIKLGSSYAPGLNSTTFHVCPEIKDESVDNSDFRDLGQEIISGTIFQDGKISWTDNLGFVDSVIHAYNNHHNLVIRPDDVWLAIVLQFSYYINANSEKYRKKFVPFEGKKTLEVKIPGSLYSAPYDLMIDLFKHKIHENVIDPELRDFIIPNFSTTTDDDVIVSGIMLMSTVQRYFNYKMYLMCGIPHVTLEGTVEDWQNIYDRIDKLYEYDLGQWVFLLEPVLKEFVNAKTGRFDRIFWQKIANKIPRGSNTALITGWITVFNVFNSKGEWLGDKLDKFERIADSPWLTITEDEISNGNTMVNLEIVDYRKTYKTQLVAGHFGFTVLPDSKTLQPKSGWYLALKNENEEYSGEF